MGPIARLVAAGTIAASFVGGAVPAPGRVGAEPVPAGRVLRVHVAEAFGGKTVLGQLTATNVTAAGHVTAFGCDDGLPIDDHGRIVRSDLNYYPSASPTWSNRLIVQADADGDVCFHTLAETDLVVDVNGVSFDTGISSFPNRRTDTRDTAGRRLAAGDTLRVPVPEAAGAKTVIGQLTVAGATDHGHITAYACADGPPVDASDRVIRSDLNYFGRAAPAWSNRLIVQADAGGNICFDALTAVDLVIDVNGVSDTGIFSFPNRRTDTRDTARGRLAAGDTLRVPVPEAAGAKTVIGQLTVAGATDHGHITAYACADGPPVDASDRVIRSDLNYFGRAAPAWSNRLIVQADAGGNICFDALTAVDLVIDVNGVSDTGIFSFPNRRTDTRDGNDGSEVPPRPVVDGVPVWPPFTPLPALDRIAALTGATVASAVARRPITAVKIDNYRSARPQWGLDRADAVIEVQAEGVSRFVALFHSDLPASVGPARSARTGDLDLLAAMNRPVFAYSGANPGVTSWIAAADSAGVLVDFSAQSHGCYARRADRPGPHDLAVDPSCAVGASSDAGSARSLWAIDPDWSPSADLGSSTDTSFSVPMSGVTVSWSWDPPTRSYLRSQDGLPHVADGDVPIAADTVVVISTEYVPSVVDARSPHAVTTGSGPAVVHRDGRAVSATWSRPTSYDPFVFRATDGTEIPLDAGTTWLELAPR